MSSPDLTWHKSLEKWCAEHFGLSRRSIREQADFAPFEAHKPEKFHEVAVVLVVLTSATRSLHRGFTEAVELIRASTSAFRVVLVSDLYQSPALDVCDWPVEQLLAEEMWSAHQQSNWLAQASEHVQAAQQSYGASYVVAPDEAKSAAAALRHMAYVYNAPSPALAQALEILAESLDGGAEALGFRHGWETPAAGGSQHRAFLSAEGEEVAAQLHYGCGSGVVVDPGDQLPHQLLRAAQNAGWSTAVFPAAGDGSPAAGRFATNVQRACADALKRGGPVLVCSAAGGPLVASADGRIEPMSSAGQCSIELNSIAALRFTPAEAPGVFDRLQSINSTLLSR